MSRIYNINTVRAYVEENSECQTISTEYVNYNTKMKFRCKCGEVFETSFAKFKDRNKKQCNNCGRRLENENTRFTIDGVKHYVLQNSNCILLSVEYLDNKSKLDFQCECGNKFKVPFEKFKDRNRRQCKTCGIELRAVQRRKTQSQFEIQIEEMYKGEYSVLEEYKNDFTKILVRHNECGYEYRVRPSNILRNRKCPICTSSNGEYQINRWLIENNFTYEREYTFDDLVSDLDNPLRFDFAIFKNNTIKMLIEFDGEQHQRHIKGWQTIQDFKKLKLHDSFKDNYCKDNNIKLVRIPYTDIDNINEILKSIL